jgi:hypothetical protein
MTHPPTVGVKKTFKLIYNVIFSTPPDAGLTSDTVCAGLPEKSAL